MPARVVDGSGLVECCNRFILLNTHYLLGLWACWTGSLRLLNGRSAMESNLPYRRWRFENTILLDDVGLEAALSRLLILWVPFAKVALPLTQLLPT